MTIEELRARVLTVILRTLDLQDADDILTPAIYRTPGWDSLATISIIEGIESEFDVEISNEQLEEFTSLERMTTLLSSALVPEEHQGKSQKGT